MDTNNVKIVGLGGMGCRVVHRLMAEDTKDIKLVACDTDKSSLGRVNAHYHVLLGKNLSYGAGGQKLLKLNWLMGLKGKDNLMSLIEGTDMLFLVAGMGGDIATTAAALLAMLAKKAGVLTIAIVTKPFSFEGPARNDAAEQGINELIEVADTTIVIPNDRLLSRVEHVADLSSAFSAVEPELINMIKQITFIMIKAITTYILSLDMKDFRKLLGNAGRAHIGMGKGSGVIRAIEATIAAIQDLYLTVPLNKATRVVCIMNCCHDLHIRAVYEVNWMVGTIAKPETPIVYAVTIDWDAKDTVEVTLITSDSVRNQSLPVYGKADGVK